MSFSLPTFNLVCNIWPSNALPPLNPKRLSSLCNLAWGKRVALNGVGSTGPFTTLLLPRLSDIRSDKCGAGIPDFVEVPGGSGRYYLVEGVEDIGKGFANEHRVAVLFPSVLAGMWPAPIP